jgi:DNA-binding LacI/PurR family transcriptional regulator
VGKDDAGLSKRRRATIVDVAEKAGVSKGLVSFVLNDRPGVAPATRQRILDAVQELDWRPSQAARSLINDRAYAMGFVLARPADLLAGDPFFPAFIAGVEAELSARNSALVLQVVPDVDAELDTYRRLVADKRVDGVLVADLRVDDPRPGVLAGLGLPAVTLGRPDGPRACPAVVLDDAPGVAAAVDHLADLGHQRVAFVGGPEEFLHARHRRDAWRTALERRGLPHDEQLALDGDFSGDSGATAMARLLAMDERDRPTAVLFANDLMAVAAVAAAQRQGCRVPDDISVVGFDDIAVAAHVHPSLTTVRQDAVAWGRAATRAVFDQVEHGRASDVELAPAQLVIRGSTAQARVLGRRRRTAPTIGTPSKGKQ